MLCDTMKKLVRALIHGYSASSLSHGHNVWLGGSFYCSPTYQERHWSFSQPLPTDIQCDFFTFNPHPARNWLMHARKITRSPVVQTCGPASVPFTRLDMSVLGHPISIFLVPGYHYPCWKGLIEHMHMTATTFHNQELRYNFTKSRLKELL